MQPGPREKPTLTYVFNFRGWGLGIKGFRALGVRIWVWGLGENVGFRAFIGLGVGV